MRKSILLCSLVACAFAMNAFAATPGATSRTTRPATQASATHAAEATEKVPSTHHDKHARKAHAKGDAMKKEAPAR